MSPSAMSGQPARAMPFDADPPRPQSVTGPAGTPITMDDLPPPSTTRWVMRRKAEVVFAVRGGLLSLEEACERWHLTPEEYQSWETLIDRYGLRGLRTTRLQQYRNGARRSERRRP